MERLVLSRQPLPLPGSCSSPSPAPRRRFPTRIRCSPLHSPPPPIDVAVRTTQYQPGVLDDLFLSFFRSKMVEEVKWDSQKPGYDGLIEVANHLMTKGRTNAEVAESAVFVERCRYLEEAKCVGICINTCRQPTQAFFKDCMGVPLTMEPNFKDYSCQFKFGVPPPHVTEDKFLMEPCLEICPTASRRRVRNGTADIEQCPKA